MVALHEEIEDDEENDSRASSGRSFFGTMFSGSEEQYITGILPKIQKTVVQTDANFLGVFFLSGLVEYIMVKMVGERWIGCWWMSHDCDWLVVDKFYSDWLLVDKLTVIGWRK